MKSHIVNNFKIKLTVLFLAFLIWFFVKIEDNYRHSFNIPLRVTNLEPNRIIGNKIPKRIKIACWGKGRYLFSLMLRKDIFYNLDVSKVRNSAKLVLDVDQIKLLHETDIEILNIVSPETVEVVVNDLITKKVPILPDVEIHTAPGYTVVDKIVLNPDSVEITGPESEIKKIKSIITENKRYENLKRDLKKKLQLMKPDIDNFELLTQETQLYVDIQKLMEKPFYEIPVKVRNTPPNLNVIVTPSTLSLVLEGGTDVLLNVTKQDIDAYLDYRKIQASKNIYHLAYIDTPDGTRHRDVKPKHFKVIFEKIR